MTSGRNPGKKDTDAKDSPVNTSAPPAVNQEVDEEIKKQTSEPPKVSSSNSGLTEIKVPDQPL